MRIGFLFLSFIYSLGACCNGFANTNAPRSSQVLKKVSLPETRLTRQIRSTWDVAQLNWKNVSSISETLVVGRVEPSEKSGVGIAHSVYIKAETGEFVHVPGKRDTILADGQFHILQSINGTTELKNRSYQGEFIFNRFGRQPIEFIRYKPFVAYGGAVICKIDDTQQGMKQYEPLCFIPEEWTRYVAPAFTYFHQKSELLDVSKTSVNKTKLQALLKDTNPLIATAAFKLLLETKQMSRVELMEYLSQARGVRQAVYYLLLVGRKSEELPPLDVSVKLKEIIKASKSDGELSGMALGAIVTSMYAVEHFLPFESWEPSRTVLEEISGKVQWKPKNQPTDEYLDFILQKAQVGKYAVVLPQQKKPQARGQ